MAVPVELIQNSQTWKDFRSGHSDGVPKIGSSTAPIIMGASPYMTRHHLWQVMSGIAPEPNFDNPAIRKGQEVEPVARATYAIQYDRDVRDNVVLVHDEIPWMIASLDGYFEFTDAEGRFQRGILEIKVPRVEVFEAAKAGRVHEDYVWQLEHQLLVSGADFVDFMCVRADDQNGRWVIGEHVIVRYISDPDRRALLFEKEHEFRKMVEEGTEPELAHEDTLYRTEPEVVEIYEELAKLKDEEDALGAASKAREARMKVLKEMAAAKMIHTRESCAGLVLTKQTTSSVDKTRYIEAASKLLDPAPYMETKTTVVLRRAKS